MQPGGEFDKLERIQFLNLTLYNTKMANFIKMAIFYYFDTFYSLDHVSTWFEF